MSGAHRGRASWSVRWLLMVLAISGSIIALIGLVSYLFAIATDLELWAGTWIMSVAVLARTFVSKDRRLLWPSAATAALASWQLLDAFARHAAWPAGELHLIDSAGGWLRWLTLAVLAKMVAADIKSAIWRRWRSSGQDSSESG